MSSSIESSVQCMGERAHKRRKQSNVKKLQLSSQQQSPSQLPIRKLRPQDVLCGRGGLANKHAGNIIYRTVVQRNKGLYQQASLPNHKAFIVISIIEAIRKHEGRFLRKDEGSNTWREIGDTEAYHKTSQALREQEGRRTAATKTAAAVAPICATGSAFPEAIQFTTPLPQGCVSVPSATEQTKTAKRSPSHRTAAAAAYGTRSMRPLDDTVDYDDDSYNPNIIDELFDGNYILDDDDALAKHDSRKGPLQNFMGVPFTLSFESSSFGEDTAAVTSTGQYDSYRSSSSSSHDGSSSTTQDEDDDDDYYNGDATNVPFLPDSSNNNGNMYPPLIELLQREDSMALTHGFSVQQKESLAYSNSCCFQQEEI